MAHDNKSRVNLPYNFKIEDEQNQTFTGEKLQAVIDAVVRGVDNSLDINGSNKLAHDIDLNGHKIINSEDAEGQKDLVTLEQAVALGLHICKCEVDKNKPEVFKLTEQGSKRIAQYVDGLRVIFKASGNSVANPQISINDMPAKKILFAGKCSIMQSRWIEAIYLESEGGFRLLNSENMITEVAYHEVDLNEIGYSTKFYISDIKNVKNWPFAENDSSNGNRLYGMVTVESVEDDRFVIQTVVVGTGETMRRIVLFEGGKLQETLSPWANIVGGRGSFLAVENYGGERK